MCVAVPVKVVKLHGDGMADVELGGVIKDVSLDLLDGVEVGDYVIVHAGYAISKLDLVEAERTLALFAEAGVGT